ncbi:MAG: D-alanine--D-alanine ligase [Treponema sp.]|nr:D-alanine--D-alanine ligase [Treponema sp.]
MTVNNKITVGIIFGGKSAEHEVSLQSAKNVYDAIDRNKFDPVLIGIDKNGVWRSMGGSLSLLNSGDPRRISLNPDGIPVTLGPASGGLLSAKSAEGPKIDVIFPILHGPLGEDGTVQGLLKLAGVPFVGSGVLGSAVGMDKDVMKRLFRDAGLPIGKFLTFKHSEKLPPFAEIEAALGSPSFVKPANMGSSVGVSKIRSEAEYENAVKEAFKYDVKIIIEEFIPGREIECAVLGNENPTASIPGEVIPSHEFYSYDAKYIDENGARLEIPAKIDDDCKRRVQELAVKAFQTLCCEGLSRVDFFLKEDGGILINEINTMPGFTRVSMYPKLWEAGGIGYTELITRLIELALQKSKEQ